MQYGDDWQEEDDEYAPLRWWEQAELDSPADAMPEGYLRAYYDSDDEWIGEQPYDTDEYVDSMQYDDDFEDEPTTVTTYYTSPTIHKKSHPQYQSLNSHELQVKRRAQERRGRRDGLLLGNDNIPLPKYTGSYEDEIYVYQDTLGQKLTPNVNSLTPSSRIQNKGADDQQQGELLLQGIETFYDDSGYYAYVLLTKRQGEVTSLDLQRVVTRLKQIGVQKVLSGRSYRPASNGKQYQCYIRIADAQGRKPSKGIVERALQVTSSEQTGHLTNIQKVVQQLQNTLTHEQQEKRALLDRIQAIQADYTAEQQKTVVLTQETSKLKAYVQKRAVIFRDEKTKLLSQLGDLQAELEQTLQQGAENQQQIDKLNADRQQTASALAQAQAERVNAEEEVTIFEQLYAEEKADLERRMQEQEDKYVDACNERDIAVAEIENLRAELLASQDNNRILSNQVASAPNSKRAADDFKNMLDCLLPHLEVCEESVYFLLVEVQSYTKILQELQILNSDPQAFMRRSKRVQSAKEWMEMSHVSIGDSDNGRIYYTKSPSTGKYIVLVSHKETQKRDIEKLEKWSL